MSKITQKQAVFYKLYKARLENKEKYVPIWEFLGEILVEERGEWVFMSYKCPTRLTDIYQENPGLLEREYITGRSGAMYYGYRFPERVTTDLIKDPKLLSFFNSIK